MKRITKLSLIEVELEFMQEKDGSLSFNFDDNIDTLNDIGSNFEVNQIKKPTGVKER